MILSGPVYGVSQASICVGSMPGVKPGVSGPVMTTRQTYIAANATLTIHIADKEMVSSPKRGGRITGLDMAQRHLIEIRQDNKTRVSFWLSFQDYKKEDEVNADVCLYYYKGYGTFSILQASDERCHCSAN